MSFVYLSSLRRHRASIKYFTDESDSVVDDSNNLVTMLDNTGRSAITAVVITELFSELLDTDVVNAPPVTGFNPRIQTKCWRV